MNLNPKLNLVIPVERDNGMAYVHAAPLSREVFDQYFFIISQTFAAIYGGGLTSVAGPRVAALMMHRIAKKLEVEDEVEPLFAEMRRLSNVIVPGQPIVPLQEALNRKFFDADDVSEVENAIAFFIVASAIHKRSEVKAVLTGAARMWGAQITSLNSTEYAASLPTSTEDENTGAKTAA
jgi:hypothetical protein